MGVVCRCRRYCLVCRNSKHATQAKRLLYTAEKRVWNAENSGEAGGDYGFSKNGASWLICMTLSLLLFCRGDSKAGALKLEVHNTRRIRDGICAAEWTRDEDESRTFPDGE